MVTPPTLLTLVNTILILGTIILGIQTTIFQRRTSLRESLEQLDSLHPPSGAGYIGIILHDFSYIPLWKERAVLKFYVRTPDRHGKANVGQIRNTKKHIEKTYDLSVEQFLEDDIIEDTWVEDSGFYIETNTVDAVKCRTLAEDIQVDIQLADSERDELPR